MIEVTKPNPCRRDTTPPGMYQDVDDYATNTQTLAADTTYTGASGSNDPTATTAGKSLGLDIKREKQN